MFQTAPVALTAMLILLPVAATPGHAAPPAAASSTTAREAATRAKLATVRAEIARIAATQRATAARRDAINAKLAEQATQIDHAANAVQDSDAAIAAKTAALAKLAAQRTRLEASLSTQRAALADLLRAAYTLDRGTDLTLLLGDQDIARIERALAYSRYFQRDRVRRIRALLGEVAQLQDVKATIQADAAALEAQRNARTQRVARLEKARAAQAALLAEANRQLTTQKDKLAALNRDANALSGLLKQLQNVFADIPAQIGKGTPFAQLRGRLPWPVAGDPRNDPDAPAHGIVIAAPPGAEVHAVAYGRVAWADFMRGYGILVIIDHGDGWMSLYGGNESASVAAGDWVKPGQPIARVGRDPEPGGAWFGLRHDGNAVDPRGWLARRR